MLSFASKDHSWEGPPSPEVEEREEGRGWVRRIGSEKMEKRQGRERRRREKEGSGGGGLQELRLLGQDTGPFSDDEWGPEAPSSGHQPTFLLFAFLDLYLLGFRFHLQGSSIFTDFTPSLPPQSSSSRPEFCLWSEASLRPLGRKPSPGLVVSLHKTRRR